MILTISLLALTCGKHGNPISSNGKVCEGESGTLSASGRWEEFNTANSCLPSNTIRCLEVDHNNNLWIGTDNGLVFYDGTKWIIYNTSNSGMPANSIWSLACEEDTIWVGFINNGGLAKFDGSEWTIYNSSNSLLGKFSISKSTSLKLYITALKIDSKHNIWVGTNTEGLYKFDKTNWIRYYPSYETPISSSAINSIDIDKQDVVWIAHAELFGVDKFDGTSWINYTPDNSPLPAWHVEAVYVDKMNVKWLATNLGLAEFDDINWVVYDTTNSNIKDEIIFAITSDSKNNLWIGTFSGVLISDNNHEWTTYYINDATEPAKPYHTIYSVKADLFDNKWLGTDNGLYKFNGNGIKN